MLSKTTQSFERSQSADLFGRLSEPRQSIHAVAGPRQVGKSTLVAQVTARLGIPVRYASADEPSLRGRDWIRQQWDTARLEARDAGEHGSVLVLDEIQKIPGWSETVKSLWDDDSREGRALRVVLLGSAPLLLAHGLTESLAGRFETLRLPHWSFAEMHHAFGVTIEQFIYFGGYPGAAHLMHDPARWRRFITDSLIETSISTDILLLTRVTKPALLRRLFELACQYSGQELSYTKMLGQLQDAGNSTTLAHYLELLAGAGMVVGLQKFAGDAARRRGSSPKLQVLNTALMSAMSDRSPTEARADLTHWGRLVESAIGAHLVNGTASNDYRVFWWRDGADEVDFVIQAGRRLIAIEVKSGHAPRTHRGLSAFNERFEVDRALLIGGDGISVEEFLRRPMAHWITA